jgi:hypothetical protein
VIERSTILANLFLSFFLPFWYILILFSIQFHDDNIILRFKVIINRAKNLYVRMESVRKSFLSFHFILSFCFYWQQFLAMTTPLKKMKKWRKMKQILFLRYDITSATYHGTTNATKICLFGSWVMLSNDAVLSSERVSCSDRCRVNRNGEQWNVGLCRYGFEISSIPWLADVWLLIPPLMPLRWFPVWNEIWSNEMM